MRLGGHDLFNYEALPGRADLGMREQGLLGREPEELVQKTAVPHIHPGRLDLPLAQVGMPGLKLADHQRIGQQVEVAAAGGWVDPHRARRLGGVPHLAVVVRDHRPEAQQSSCTRRTGKCPKPGTCAAAARPAPHDFYRVVGWARSPIHLVNSRMLLSALVGTTRARRKPARANRSRNSDSVRSLPPSVKTSITRSMIFA